MYAAGAHADAATVGADIAKQTGWAPVPWLGTTLMHTAVAAMECSDSRACCVHGTAEH